MRLRSACSPTASIGFPDNAGMHYSVACWEAIAGNTGAAIAALSTAFELDPKSAGWA